MSLKWSESVMFKFLELYHKHDCLWNHRLDGYKNKDARDNALGSIVKEMEIAGLTITDMKNKIKTIRTMYKKEHTLVSKTKRRSGTEEVYVPKLFWYKRADLFLNSVTSARDYSSTLNLQHYEAENEVVKIIPETPEESEFPASTSASLTAENVDIKEEVIYVVNTEAPCPTSPKQTQTTNLFCVPQNRKRKIVDDISTISAATDNPDKVVQSHESDNEFDIFAKHIAVQLKQMPLYEAIICQEQIQTILTQKRLELLSRQSSRPTTASSGFSPFHHRSPSPALSNVMEGEYWPSPISNVSCKIEEGENDSH